MREAVATQIDSDVAAVRTIDEPTGHRGSGDRLSCNVPQFITHDDAAAIGGATTAQAGDDDMLTMPLAQCETCRFGRDCGGGHWPCKP